MTLPPMHTRISHCLLKPGDYSADIDGPTDHAELHYMLAADWGTLTLRFRDGKIWWFPQFRSEPGWVEVKEWLSQVEKGIAADYGVDAEGLAERCVTNLQLTWTTD